MSNLAQWIFFGKHHDFVLHACTSFGHGGVSDHPIAVHKFGNVRPIEHQV
jgi:hypothetical protein